MRKPLVSNGGVFLKNKNKIKIVNFIIKNKGILIFAIALIITGLSLRPWNSQPVFYAHAFSGKAVKEVTKIKSPLLVEKRNIFSEKNNIQVNAVEKKPEKKEYFSEESTRVFAEKLYAIVGDAPIREMVPFIAKRNKHTAAFLVSIAKKESNFGKRSPSLKGEDCYNYWGYKGSAGRGTSMGYACFASVEEAIEKVGNRIDVLVSNNRTTPARMVDTWKCGTSCKNDPGAPSWVATVAMYFEKIVS